MTYLDRVEAYLRNSRVPFRLEHHYSSPSVPAAPVAPAARKMFAKVVLALADDRLVMLALPAFARLDVRRVAANLGVHQVVPATDQEVATVFPDCEAGAMPPFGHLYGIPVYVDPVLAEEPVIAFRAGTHTATISMAYADFARLVRPVVVDLSFHPYAVAAAPVA